MGQYEQTYFTENEVTQEVKNPTIDGLTFRGWYTTQDCSGDPYLFGETLKTDVILYADWTCDVTISFGPVKWERRSMSPERMRNSRYIRYLMGMNQNITHLHIQPYMSGINYGIF